MSRRPAHPVRREAILRASRPLLARLLGEHAAFFGELLPPLAASDRTDEAPLDAVLALVASGDPPAPLLDRLHTFDVLATGSGADALLRLDAESRLLPRGTLGDEDLALTALLDHPELAAEALPLATPAHDPARAFTEYEASKGSVVHYVDAEHRARLEAAIGARLEASDRTRRCHLHRTETADDYVFELSLGDRPKARELVDAASLATRAVTDITAQRAYVRLAKSGTSLAVRAWPPAVHEAVRRGFGEVLGGDAEFFRAEETYDLSRFLDPATALSNEGVPPLDHVEIHALTLLTPGGVKIAMGKPRANLVTSDAEPVLTLARSFCSVVAVKLFLAIEGRGKKAKVEIKAEGKKCVVEMDRDDVELVEIVRAYLVARGVLRIAGRRRDDAAE